MWLRVTYKNICLVKLKLDFVLVEHTINWGFTWVFTKAKKLSFQTTTHLSFLIIHRQTNLVTNHVFLKRKKYSLEEYQTSQNLNDSSRNIRKIRRIVVHRPSSSLSSPPASAVSTAGQTSSPRKVVCSSPSPSPSPSPSSTAFSRLHCSWPGSGLVQT